MTKGKHHDRARTRHRHRRGARRRAYRGDGWPLRQTRRSGSSPRGSTGGGHARHHIGEGDLEEAIIEPFEGGRWYERTTDGNECDWGTVLVWDPPRHVALSWAIDGEFGSDPNHASRIEVTFTPRRGRARSSWWSTPSSPGTRPRPSCARPSWTPVAGRRSSSRSWRRRPPDRSWHAEPVRVLVIEGEEPLAQALRSGLEREGFSVEVADDGPTGLSLATETNPDAIVVDAVLPGLDGLEILRGAAQGRQLDTRPRAHRRGRWAPRRRARRRRRTTP